MSTYQCQKCGWEWDDSSFFAGVQGNGCPECRSNIIDRILRPSYPAPPATDRPKSAGEKCQCSRCKGVRHWESAPQEGVPKEDEPIVLKTPYSDVVMSKSLSAKTVDYKPVYISTEEGVLEGELNELASEYVLPRFHGDLVAKLEALFNKALLAQLQQLKEQRPPDYDDKPTDWQIGYDRAITAIDEAIKALE